MKNNSFLTREQEQHIVRAIKEAEQTTSGEIRVHLEKKSGGDPFDRAREVFHQLQMEQTQQRNAVLFYVAVADKTFAVYADKGINDVVQKDFWEQICHQMQQLFRQGRFAEGLIAGIRKTGEQLQQFFPYDKESDKNELPDELSIKS